VPNSIACRVALAAILLALLAPAPARAQGTALVPTSDLVYSDIDRLAELGVVDSLIIGQRPYSRREIARIARVARERMDGGRTGNRKSFSEAVNGYAEALLNRVERVGRDADDRPISEPEVALVDGFMLSASSTDADRRSFASPGTRQTETTVDPLARRRLGRPADRGQQVSLELAQRIEPTSWLAIQARERIEARWPDDTTLSNSTGELLLASARARFKNVALTVGRQQITWAQREGDGLFLASDAPALDQISLTNDRPYVLPSLLRLLGPVQGTLVYAELGKSVVRSHSKLLAYKVSVQPTNSIELGGTFMNHFGGSGARSSSTLDQLIDFLPFIDVFRKHNYSDSTSALDVDSDKSIGADARWRISALGGVTVMGEVLLDDFDPHRIPKLFTGYGSQSAAIIIPQIGSPNVSLRLGAKHMGIITYSHFALTNGMTTRGRLLGDELGPDAKSYSAQLRWDASSGVRFEVEGRSSIHSNATYSGSYSDAAQTRYVVQKVSKLPDELRDLAFATLIVQGDGGSAVSVRAGAQRIRNASFMGVSRRDYVAEFVLRYGL
jgi:hypothetical protein